MHLVGTRGQQVRDFMYDASGSITTGGTAQLLLPEHAVRTSLYIQNTSTGPLYVDFGGARAHAVLTSGVVTSIVVDNAGFGYTVPPTVHFFGGGDSTKNPNALIPGLPGNQSPSTIASAIAVLSGGTVASISINSGGKNYVKAPYVFLRSRENDPYGCASPSVGGVGTTVLVPNGGSLFYNGSTLTTDAISILGATTGQTFACKYTIGG